MKVVVVGGGIFGVTAAVKLARAGFNVDLFEKEKDSGVKFIVPIP